MEEERLGSLGEVVPLTGGPDVAGGHCRDATQEVVCTGRRYVDVRPCGPIPVGEEDGIGAAGAATVTDRPDIVRAGAVDREELVGASAMFGVGKTSQEPPFRRAAGVPPSRPGAPTTFIPTAQGGSDRADRPENTPDSRPEGPVSSLSDPSQWMTSARTLPLGSSGLRPTRRQVENSAAPPEVVTDSGFGTAVSLRTCRSSGGPDRGSYRLRSLRPRHRRPRSPRPRSGYSSVPRPSGSGRARSSRRRPHGKAHRHRARALTIPAQATEVRTWDFISSLLVIAPVRSFWSPRSWSRTVRPTPAARSRHRKEAPGCRSATDQAARGIHAHRHPAGRRPGSQLFAPPRQILRA
jgi:hypothetical protein